MRSRNFVLTLWLHVTEECWTVILQRMVDEGTLRFVAYGDEVCPTSGTLHFQAFCVFENARSLNSVKKLFPNCYVAVMRGSLRQNEIYCSKEGSYTKIGEEPRQGERTDLEDFREELMQGRRPVQVAFENPRQFSNYVRYHTGFDRFAAYVHEQRIRCNRDMPKVYIRIGDSGTGKTRWLDDFFGPGNWARMPNPTGNWWITPTVSYSDTVLIDDIGPTKVPKIEEILEWTDRYPIEFNAKGGFLWWKPKNIVITSNLSWERWWPNLTEEHKEAFGRRIYRIDLVYTHRDVDSFYPNGEDAVHEAQG